MSTPEPFDLTRFVTAQEGVYERVCMELRAGCKQSHWMWFMFPQMRGLGVSATAQHFGIRSLAEAQAYLAHPLLGPRLEEATRLALGLWAFLAQRPRLYRTVTGPQMRLLGWLGRRKGRFAKLPLAGGWTRFREMPAPQGKTFQQLWAERQRNRTGRDKTRGVAS